MIWLLAPVLFISALTGSAIAATSKVGSSCTKAGAIASSASQKLVCSKVGKKLIWRSKVAIASTTHMTTPEQSAPTSTNPAPMATPSATPSAAPVASPTPTPAAVPTVYTAKDHTTVRELVAREGCGNPNNATFIIQAQVGLLWLPVTPIDSGWSTSNACSNPVLGQKNSLAWAKVYMDAGTTYRWLYTGEVNIEGRDGQGHGLSKSMTLPSPLAVLTPHPVEGPYGITWDNLVSKFNDIAAAAWTDAQATMKRNQDLPNAVSGYRSYISPGALAVDPKIGEAEKYLKRDFILYARFPAAKNIVFVATTQEERVATEAQMDLLYPDDSWMKSSLDSIYGINTGEPQGSVFTHPQCAGNDGARNTVSYPDTKMAAALIISICPAIGNQNPHEGGVHGMAHEYVHTIQSAILVNDVDRSNSEPCWLVEGEPEWTQAVVSDTFSQYLLNKHLHPYYLTSSGLQYMPTTARTWTADEVAAYLNRANDPTTCSTTNEFALSYSLGAATTEALVAIGGSESFFTMEEKLANRESTNQAFSEVYGKSWDDALPALSQVVAQTITKAWEADATTYQTVPAN